MRNAQGRSLMRSRPRKLTLQERLDTRDARA